VYALCCQSTRHLKILTEVSLYIDIIYVTTYTTLCALSLKTQVWLNVTMGIPGLQMGRVGFVILPYLVSLLSTALLSL